MATAAEIDMVVRARDQASNTLREIERRVGPGGLSGAIKQFASNVASTATGFVAANVVMRGFNMATNLVSGGIVGMNAMLEKTQIQFTTLMKDADKAKEHVAGLFKFGAETPFETGPIIQASRMLQTFGGSALNTIPNIRMIGDAAAGASRDISEVAFWTGRAYTAIQGGRPFGEASMRLMEMGIMSGTARQKIEDLQKSGASAAEVWKEFSSIFERFEGSMKVQAKTWEGLVSTITDNIGIASATAMKPFFDLLKDGLGIMADFVQTEGFTKFAEDIADKLSKAILVVRMLHERVSGLLAPLNNISAAAPKLDLSPYIRAGLTALDSILVLLAALADRVLEAAAGILMLGQHALGELMQKVAEVRDRVVEFAATLLVSDDAVGALAITIGTLLVGKALWGLAQAVPTVIAGLVAIGTAATAAAVAVFAAYGGPFALAAGITVLATSVTTARLAWEKDVAGIRSAAGNLGAQIRKVVTEMGAFRKEVGKDGPVSKALADAKASIGGFAEEVRRAIEIQEIFREEQELQRNITRGTAEAVEEQAEAVEELAQGESKLAEIAAALKLLRNDEIRAREILMKQMDDEIKAQEKGWTLAKSVREQVTKELEEQAAREIELAKERAAAVTEAVKNSTEIRKEQESAFAQWLEGEITRERGLFKSLVDNELQAFDTRLRDIRYRQQDLDLAAMPLKQRLREIDNEARNIREQMEKAAEAVRPFEDRVAGVKDALEQTSQLLTRLRLEQKLEERPTDFEARKRMIELQIEELELRRKVLTEGESQGTTDRLKEIKDQLELLNITEKQADLRQTLSGLGRARDIEDAERKQLKLQLEQLEAEQQLKMVRQEHLDPLQRALDATSRTRSEVQKQLDAIDLQRSILSDQSTLITIQRDRLKEQLEELGKVHDSLLQRAKDEQTITQELRDQLAIIREQAMARAGTSKAETFAAIAKAAADAGDPLLFTPTSGPRPEPIPYQHGGVVPGLLGAKRLIVAHGGERVVSLAEQARGERGGPVLINYGIITTDDADDWFMRRYTKARRQGRIT